MKRNKKIKAKPRVGEHCSAKRWAAFGGPVRSAGVLVPLFSLRSSQGLGVGELPDLKLLIDWCVQTDLKVIQLLPLNDTGLDPSPYSAQSSLALNPLYLALHEVEGSAFITDLMDNYRQQFNSSSRLSYRLVRTIKLKLLFDIFHPHVERLQTDPDFQKYLSENQWLLPYSVFCVLKEKFDQKWWREWPLEYQTGSPELVDSLSKNFPVQCLFYQFIQWQLEKQFQDVRDYAEKNGVALKGDIPILMSDDSVDIWLHRKYFNFSLKAGAPPDMFSDEGQNWGFPIYNWNVLEEDDFLWWIQRLKQMEKFYHAIRIDHVLGFFRIWAVHAREKTARLGIFVPSVPISKRTLSKLGLKAPDIQRLIQPRFHRKELMAQFGPEYDRIVKTYFVSAPRSVYYQFTPAIRGEEDIAELSKDHPTEREQLYKLWSNRTLIESEDSPGTYSFRWAYPDTNGFLTLKKSTQRAILQFNARYERRQNSLWKKNGTKLLSMILDNSDLLICAEDLGYVPPIVRPVLKQLGILSLKVERWAKNYKVKPSLFIDPRKYPALSVCTPSVHDTTTLRGW